MTVADRIKQIREKKSLSQDALAQKLGLKNRSSISRIESSGNDITLKDVERIASALDVSVAYLMGYEDTPTPYEYAKEDDYISLKTKIDKQTFENTRAMVDNIVMNDNDNIFIEYYLKEDAAKVAKELKEKYKILLDACKGMNAEQIKQVARFAQFIIGDDGANERIDKYFDN